MIHYGDITKISGYDVPVVDCIIGGSPCQDLSVAGKRAGLDGERSGLFMEQIRITKEMRARDEQSGRTGEFIRPRFLVWENVPGAFSSNKGEDFRIVLEEIAKVVQEDAVIPMPPKNKWTTSGAIVGDGWSIAWRILDAQFWGVPQRRRRISLIADFGGGCASEILFERKGLRRDSSESRAERKGATTDAQGCLGVHDRDGKTYGFPLGFRPENVRCYEETATTLCVGTRSADTDHIPCVVMDRSAYNQGENAKYNIGIDEKGVAFSHIAKGPGAVCYKKPHYIVRRLTPLECERLQGVEDGWTDIGEYTDGKGKKKKTSDTARYKALGNSIALPPWKWVIKRLCSHYERDATLASLFDGIGGFPCLWEQINGKGSCLWASEIEDFPMAVTTVRIE